MLWEGAARDVRSALKRETEDFGRPEARVASRGTSYIRQFSGGEERQC